MTGFPQIPWKPWIDWKILAGNHGFYPQNIELSCKFPHPSLWYSMNIGYFHGWGCISQSWANDGFCSLRNWQNTFKKKTRNTFFATRYAPRFSVTRNRFMPISVPFLSPIGKPLPKLSYASRLSFLQLGGTQTSFGGSDRSPSIKQDKFWQWRVYTTFLPWPLEPWVSQYSNSNRPLKSSAAHSAD